MMTPEERKSLAQQLMANPLWDALFDDIEQRAIEACVYAKDDETRHRAAMRVQEVRTLRSDCEASLRSTEKRKAAPA